MGCLVLIQFVQTAQISFEQMIRSLCQDYQIWGKNSEANCWIEFTTFWIKEKTIWKWSHQHHRRVPEGAECIGCILMWRLDFFFFHEWSLRLTTIQSFYDIYFKTSIELFRTKGWARRGCYSWRSRDIYLL